MHEDELIFLGAALLLAPKLASLKKVDPESNAEVQTAVAYARLLHAEVMKEGQRPKAPPRLTLNEQMQKEGKI